jgi:neopullulanase
VLRIASLFVAFTLVFSQAFDGQVAKPEVVKVEPPNWWADYTLNPVTVLIRGRGLSDAQLTATGGLTTNHIRVNGAGTYLFADVSIQAGAKAGAYPLQIKTAGGSATVPFRIDAPLPPEGRFAGFSPDDVIYLIMPDRFANGDPSNDNPKISKGLFDRSNSYFYHGGDLQGVIDHLPYLKSFGVTALWLTPVYDNVNEPNMAQAVGGKPRADYHGYGAVDYYGIEEHFGTFDLLRKLVDEAHRMGLKVIQDQVANHVSPYHPWVADPPTPSWFHGNRAHHMNETFEIWNLIDPHASEALRTAVLDGWFQDVLPDMNQDDPEAARYEIQNALWWVGTAGFDGIRQDTLPYVPRGFWTKWSAALKQQYSSLRAVGEVFDGNPALPSYFQSGCQGRDGVDVGVDTVFDFPAYFSIRDAFARGKDLEQVAKTLGDDRLYCHPEMLVTFLGNHDVQRFMNEPGATPDGLKLAFTFLLTARGTPTIYYGDEIGMKGGEDPDNRRDFPGGWREDRRNAFTASGRTAEESEMFNYVQKLTALRSELQPLRRGEMRNLTVSKQAWVYLRRSPAGTVIVALNNGTGAVSIPVRFDSDKQFHSRLGLSGDLIFQAGQAIIHLPGRKAEIWAE